MRPRLRTLLTVVALVVTPRFLAAMSCRPLTEYVYVQCAGGACTVVFRARQVFTLQCERRTVVDSLADTSLVSLVDRIRAHDAGAGHAWVATLRFSRTAAHASRALDDASLSMLPPTGDGSIAAERGRWTARAARETLRWRVWYAVEIALCIVVALGIIWSAREVIAYARAPRGGTVTEPKAAVLFQAGAFMYALVFAMGVHVPPATMIAALILPLILIELALLVTTGVRRASATAVLCYGAASVASAQAPCGELPAAQAYVRCDTLACHLTPVVVERRQTGCTILATIDTLPPVSRAALRPTLDSLARLGPAIYRLDGLPFAFDELARGDASWLTVARSDEGLRPSRRTLLRRLESHAGSVNNRAGREGGRSPPWESVLIVVCAVFIVIGVRRRSAGRPWAAWTIPALAVQLVAIRGLGPPSIAGYPLAWAMMLASIALVFVELAVCAWALVARAPAPR